jgi:deazaflavin-dependent oxidoreductase (nitroreductase family)
MKQSLLDRIRTLNKHGINRLMIRIAGRRFGHFAVLTHRGRKTGKTYRIPIIAEPEDRGFVIALTYGRKTDWLANVFSAGGCSLRWKDREYLLTRPEYVDRETGLRAFPPLFRGGLRLLGIRDFIRLWTGNEP